MQTLRWLTKTHFHQQSRIPMYEMAPRLLSTMAHWLLLLLPDNRFLRLKLAQAHAPLLASLALES